MKLYVYTMFMVVLCWATLIAKRAPLAPPEIPAAAVPVPRAEEIEEVTEETEKSAIEKPKIEKPAIYEAAEKGDVKEVRYLLDTGTNPNVTVTSRQLTPLMIAVENAIPGSDKRDDYLVITKLLLKKNADPRAHTIYTGPGDPPAETVLQLAENLHVDKKAVDLINRALRGQPIQ